jgi:hypothetical protein
MQRPINRFGQFLHPTVRVASRNSASSTLVSQAPLCMTKPAPHAPAFCAGGRAIHLQNPTSMSTVGAPSSRRFCSCRHRGPRRATFACWGDLGWDTKTPPSALFSPQKNAPGQSPARSFPAPSQIKSDRPVRLSSFTILPTS